MMTMATRMSTPKTSNTMMTNIGNSIIPPNYTDVAVGSSSVSGSGSASHSTTRSCKINVNKKKRKQNIKENFVNNLSGTGAGCGEIRIFKNNSNNNKNTRAQNGNSTTNINNKCSINNRGDCHERGMYAMATTFSLLSPTPLPPTTAEPEATTGAHSRTAMPESGLPTGAGTAPTYISGKGNCETVQLNSKQSKQCQQLAAVAATATNCSKATPWEREDILASHEHELLQLGADGGNATLAEMVSKTRKRSTTTATLTYSENIHSTPVCCSQTTATSRTPALWPFSILRQSLQYASSTVTATTSTSSVATSAPAPAPTTCNAAGPTLGNKLFRGILMTLLVLSVCHNNVLPTSAAAVISRNESISFMTLQTKAMLLVSSSHLSTTTTASVTTNTTTNATSFVSSADQKLRNQTNLPQLPLSTLQQQQQHQQQQQTLENPLQILENNNNNNPPSNSEKMNVAPANTTKIGITGTQPKAEDQILLMAPKQKRQQRGHQLPQYLTSTQGTSFVVNATATFDGAHKNAFQATSMVGGRLIVPMDDDDTQTQQTHHQHQQPPPLPFNRSQGGAGGGTSFGSSVGINSAGSISEDFNELMPFSAKRNTMPVFDYGMPQNITARTGHMEAVLKCRVDRIGDKSVSWIRKRDLHILTVGKTTYTSDNRFLVTESKDSREWTLHVKSPQVRDSGIYECQVNTEPKMSMAFQLNIIEISSDAQTIITGPSDLYVKVGSVITLTCLVSQPSIKDIGPIHWYRGEHLLMPFAATDETAPQRNYFVTPAALTSKSASFDHAAIPGSAGAAALDDVDVYDNNVDDDDDDEHMSSNGNNEITLDFRQRVAMEQKLCDTIKSKLRISNAQISDSGNYTCQPTTSSSASVTVHVINDENPAAMQKGGTAGGRSL